MPPPILVWVIILPIVPALVLFKFLPEASGSLGGKVYGVTVKFGGPIALYFAVLWVVMHAPSLLNPPKAYQVWEVSGQVVDQDGNTIGALNPTDIALSPPNPDIQPNGGAFKVKFVTVPGLNGGVMYPDLYVTHLNLDGKTTVAYVPAPVFHLDPKQLQQHGADVNYETQEISLKIIKLNKAPTYTAAVGQSLPQAVSTTPQHQPPP